MLKELRYSTLVGKILTIGKRKKQWIIRNVTVVESDEPNPGNPERFCIIVSGSVQREKHKTKIRTFVFDATEIFGEMMGENDWRMYISKSPRVAIHMGAIEPAWSIAF